MATIHDMTQVGVAPTGDPIVDVARMLESTHVAAWSTRPVDRVRFGAALELKLSRVPDSTVCVIHGSQVEDLYSFCTQLERDLGVRRIRRHVDGKGGVVETLRTRASHEESPAVKHRFYIWRDADVLLKSNHRLFGRLVDALAGVAAAAEYCDEDLLLLHRVVFVGGPALAGYDEDANGQFRSWFQEDDEKPLWGVISGLQRPPVAMYPIPLER